MALLLLLYLAEANDWRLPQSVPEDDDPADSVRVPDISLAARGYGFLESYSGYFTYVRQSANDLNELGERAEIATPAERREIRIAREEIKWDEEYYM